MPEQHAASQPDLWQLRLMIAAQAFGFVRKLWKKNINLFYKD